MRAVLLRKLFDWGVVVTLCVLLASCGGGSGEETVADNPVGSPPPVSLPPPVSPPPAGEAPVEIGLMVAFDYNSLAAGAPLRAERVQNLAVGNGTASYRFPRSGERISGNLTIAADVADPDGIARVLVGFNGSEQALVLCDTNCGNTFSQTVTGINPRNFGLNPGSLRLELWLEDQLGNRILFDARDIEWIPEAVVGVNTTLSSSALQVNWTANSNARRYNLYIAEQPGITPDTILSKTGGRQFLALSQPTLSISDLDVSKRHFVLITGIDSSGESVFSQEHLVQAFGDPEFSLPIAVPDQFTLNEDTSFSDLLLSNDSHPDGSSFALDTVAVRPPDNGVLELNADGRFTYQPSPNFVGNDSFIYQITDSQGLTAQALVSLTVLAVNDSPTVLSDSYSTDKNIALSVNAPGVLANDLDLDGDSLIVDSEPVIAPAHGSLLLNPDGAFSYTPAFNYAGEDFFVYQVSDGNGAVAQARVDLRIEMTNAAPIAQNDSYQLAEDERLLVAVASGLLANDSDPDGDPVSLVTELLAVPKSGQLLLEADGSFQYIPQQDFFGTDSFTYQIKDPAGLLSSATVELIILAKNDAPVVQGSSYSVNQNTLLTVNAPGLLAHVSDVDDQNLSLVATPFSVPAKGSLTLQADGAFSYQPKAAATGTDSFVFQVRDAAGAVSTGTVTITIIASQVPPVIAELNAEVWENASQGEVIGELVAESLEPGQVVSFSILSGNTLGVFGLTPSGVLSVANPAPLLQLAGSTVTMAVKAQDNAGLSAQINISVKVLSATVTALNDNYVVQEDTVLVSPNTVLSNDSELRGSALTASLITQPSHGSLQFSPNGQFTYSPNANFFGQDSFVYSASNGVRTAQATVSITVSPVNDPPALNATTFTFSESVAQGSVVGQLVWQDVDSDQSYSFSILSGDDTQAFTVTNQGQLVVSNSTALRARGGASGSLLVQITDSAGGSSTALIGLQLQPAFPLSSADTYVVNQDSLLQVNAANGVLANDSDPAGLGLTTLAVSSGPSHGQLNMNADGSFSYQPNTDFYGQDVFVYQASNGIRTSSAVVTITVVQVLPALQASFDTYTLAEDSLLSVSSDQSLLQNDTYDVNKPVVVSLIQAPPHGTLNLNTDGTFSYQPAAGVYGSYYFIYRLTQGNVSSDAQVELNITSVNDAPSLQDATVTISDDYVNSQHVLTMTQYDEDPGSYSYQILSGNSTGVFTITADGIIQVADSTLLDAAVTASYTLIVQVTENGDPSLVDTATVVINVTSAKVYQTSVLPDTSFAGGGNLSLEMMLSGEDNEPVQIIPLSDGRSLVIGTVSNSYEQEIFVVRLNLDGSVDSSYADKGLFRSKIFSFYTTEQAVAGVLTSSNELVLLANYQETEGSGFYLIKLSGDGSLDYNFGNSQGYLLCENAPCDSNNVQATDLILNHLGHYVVSGVKDGNQAFLFEFADTGYQDGWLSPLSAVKQFDLVRQDSNHYYYGIGQSSDKRIVIARFSSSFDLDINYFGCEPSCVGYKEYDFSSSTSSVPYDAVLYNNELYVVGSVTESSALTSPDGLFFKLTYDGSLNLDFGGAGGFIQVDGYAGYPLHYQSLAADGSGFYVLTSTAQSSDSLVSLSHYNLMGMFIQDQPLVADGHLSAVDLQSDGAGLWLLQQYSNPHYVATDRMGFNWVGKFHYNTLAADTAFSADGQRWFNAGFSEDVLLGSQRLLLGSQTNKTLFYGFSYSYLNGAYVQAFVGRLTASGALDQSFGNHGLMLLATDQLKNMNVQTIEEASSNQAYVVGYGYDHNDAQVGYVLRLNQDGSLDSGFASGVFALAPAAAGSYQESSAIKLQVRADGRVLVGAEYSSDVDNSKDVVLLQLTADGSLDTGNFGSSFPGYSVFTELDPSAVVEDQLSQMKLDPADDSLVIAGQHLQEADPQLYVARFNAAGILMNSVNSPTDTFGQSGQGYSLINLIDTSGNPMSHEEFLTAMDFDAGRNLILALAAYSDQSAQTDGSDESYENGEVNKHYLYRLQHNGLTDTSFNFGNPRLYDSFSDQTPINLIIREIKVDDAGRLLMAGISGIDTWVGRVLLDGSGTDAGRWDPAFEMNSATPGAYVFRGYTFSYELFLELTSTKVTIGWNDYDSGGYSATLRQFQLYEYHYNPVQ